MRDHTRIESSVIDLATRRRRTSAARWPMPRALSSLTPDELRDFQGCTEWHEGRSLDDLTDTEFATMRSSANLHRQIDERYHSPAPHNFTQRPLSERQAEWDGMSTVPSITVRGGTKPTAGTVIYSEAWGKA